MKFYEIFKKIYRQRFTDKEGFIVRSYSLSTYMIMRVLRAPSNISICLHLPYYISKKRHDDTAPETQRQARLGDRVRNHVPPLDVAQGSLHGTFVGHFFLFKAVNRLLRTV